MARATGGRNNVQPLSWGGGGGWGTNGKDPICFRHKNRQNPSVFSLV